MVSEAAERALAVHQRLVDGDPTAAAAAFEMMLKPLHGYLLKRHSSDLDREALRDIAVDALMFYIRWPERFDSSRAGLFRYLTLIADGNAKDALRRRRRQPAEFEPLVEDRLLPANSLSESADRLTSRHTELRVDAIAILERYRPEICSDPGDEDVLALILEGENDTAVFARALGLDAPDDAQARRTVLRVKDKIKRRLRRLKGRLEHDRS